ncbi:MAG: hypothetical protein JWQ00_245, partial [Noviherbaspirillum sp.]|nr:hypothetical protein [Noviherbaspirillum sp.]
RDVILVWAIESTDHDRQILSEDDRMYATRSAAELAQWDAADKKGAVTPELFLQKRAEQILRKIAERTPAFSRVVAKSAWPRRLGIVLPLLAFLSGALVDRIADPHRVDLLSAPLLLIIGWNLLVYLGMLTAFVRRAAEPRRPRSSLAERMAIGKISVPRKMPRVFTAALARFSEEWLTLSAPLAAARMKRIVHLSAACFAVGAIVSLYARGVLSQYQAGWESTFLNAQQVHLLLSVLFAPAIAVFQLQGFSIADVNALRFGQPVSPAGGARWVHLYAGTLFLLVILPRLVFALAARWKERTLATRFPLDLGQPYFRKLAAGIGSTAPSVLRVFPYSFTVDETRDKNLNTVARALLGDQARVMLRPSTAYGEEPPAAQDALPDNPEVGLTVALFNMSATPEKENHGAFLDHLARGSGSVSVLIDESAYLERVGTQAGGDARMRERIELWRRFCELHQVPAVIVNLLDPAISADDVERKLASSVRAR